jgi:group I intron endonuclease
MDKTKKYKIYFLKDPNTNEIRYVGLSSDVEKRYNEHIKDNKDCYKKRWINKLLLMNKQPILEVVKENLSLAEAFNFEKEYIKNFKNLGVRLTNETIGGEAPMAEKKHKEETKIIMSEKRKGQQNSFYGKKHSEETKSKLSQSLKGRETWNKGKKLTKEHIEKLKNAKIGYVPHNKNKTRFDLKLIEDLINKNFSQAEVAKIFDANHGTISRYIKKHKLKINK